MATRRSFLHGAGAVTALSAAVVPKRTKAASRLIRVERVLADRRFAESCAFAEEAARQGVVVGAFDGDITRLWVDELDALWRDHPAAIAGMTAHGPLFVLERFAWDRGLRLTLRVDHLRGAAGRHLAACPEGAAVAALLADAGAAYPAVAARLVLQRPPGVFQVQDAAAPACAIDQPEPLVTWLIAPITRA